MTQAGHDAEYVECEAHNEWNWAHLKEIDPDVLIVSDATAPTYKRIILDSAGGDKQQSYQDGVDTEYDRVSEISAPLTYMVESTPHSNCMPASGFSSPADCQPPGSGSVINEIVDYKLDSAQRHGFDVIDMTSWVCDENGVCPLLIGNSLTRADAGHLANDFSKRLSEIFVTEMAEVLP